MPKRSEGRRGRTEEAIAYRKWYGTRAWRDKREEQLTLEPYCRMCREEGKQVLATIVDHVIPHRGDYELFINGKLDSLCKSHHDSVKQSEEHTGFRKGFDNNGSPIDPKHPWHSSDPPASGPPL